MSILVVCRPVMACLPMTVGTGQTGHGFAGVMYHTTSLHLSDAVGRDVHRWLGRGRMYFLAATDGTKTQAPGVLGCTVPQEQIDLGLWDHEREPKTSSRWGDNSVTCVAVNGGSC